MREAFYLGGWGMYPTLLFGVLMVAASIRYAISPERRFVPLQVSLGVLTLMAGGLGFVTGMIKVFLSIGEVQPEQRWIWMLGLGEALNCVGLALSLIVIGAFAASVGAYRFSRMALASPETA